MSNLQAVETDSRYDEFANVHSELAEFTRHLTGMVRDRPLAAMTVALAAGFVVGRIVRS